MKARTNTSKYIAQEPSGLYFMPARFFRGAVIVAVTMATILLALAFIRMVLLRPGV